MRCQGEHAIPYPYPVPKYEARYQKASNGRDNGAKSTGKQRPHIHIYGGRDKMRVHYMQKRTWQRQ